MMKNTSNLETETLKEIMESFKNSEATVMRIVLLRTTKEKFASTISIFFKRNFILYPFEYKQIEGDYYVFKTLNPGMIKFY